MPEISQKDYRKELAFFDPNSARALVNLLPGEIATQLKLVWNGELGELFKYHDSSLVAAMSRAGHPPEPLDYILRLRFWFEFNRCQDEDWNHPKMNMAYVVGRDMPREKFYKFYITDPYKLIFMLTPPVQLRQALECALQDCALKIHHTVDKLKMFEENGSVNPASVDKLLRIFDALMRRVENSKVREASEKKGRGTKAIIPDPPPGVPVSLDEQIAFASQRVAELERLRGADAKKETGGL